MSRRKARLGRQERGPSCWGTAGRSEAHVKTRAHRKPRLTLTPRNALSNTPHHGAPAGFTLSSAPDRASDNSSATSAFFTGDAGLGTRRGRSGKQSPTENRTHRDTRVASSAAAATAPPTWRGVLRRRPGPDHSPVDPRGAAGGVIAEHTSRMCRHAELGLGTGGDRASGPRERRRPPRAGPARPPGHGPAAGSRGRAQGASSEAARGAPPAAGPWGAGGPRSSRRTPAGGARARGESRAPAFPTSAVSPQGHTREGHGRWALRPHRRGLGTTSPASVFPTAPLRSVFCKKGPGCPGQSPRGRLRLPASQVPSTPRRA